MERDKYLVECLSGEGIGECDVERWSGVDVFPEVESESVDVLVAFYCTNLVILQSE